MKMTPSQEILHLSLLMQEELLQRMSPARYAAKMGLEPYPWQSHLMDSRKKRKLVNGARQGGKSTTVAVLPAWMAHFKPGSLSIVAAAVEKQAWEDMNKIKAFVSKDPCLIVKRASDELLEFENGSRILVVPATERSARGWSAPALILLDEASRIPDPVYTSGIRPMLTHNPLCEVLAISTPNGREGFFARAWESDRWEKYEVRAPWDIVETTWELVPALPEREFVAERLRRGILGSYSPRHKLLAEQTENLLEMGARMYRQEYLCEFVETEGAAFRYSDIDAMMGNQVEGLDTDTTAVLDELEALVFDE